MKGFTMQNRNPNTKLGWSTPDSFGSALNDVVITIDTNGFRSITDKNGKPLSPEVQRRAELELNIRGSYYDAIHPRFDFGIEMPSPRAWYEEDSATIETAQLFWELIKDELETAEGWEATSPHISMFQFLNDGAFDAHEYVRGPHKINMNKEGKIKFMGALSKYIDITLNLEDGDLLEEFIAWIQKTGPCPLYRKEERDGLVWREHPPHNVRP